MTVLVMESKSGYYIMLVWMDVTTSNINTMVVWDVYGVFRSMSYTVSRKTQRKISQQPISNHILYQV